jgi:hypothetical protein
MLCACDILSKRGEATEHRCPHHHCLLHICRRGRRQDIAAILIRGDKVNYLHQLGALGGGSPKDLDARGRGWTELHLAGR